MSLENKIKEIVTSSHIGDNEKAAIHEDLMARLKNYKESINYSPQPKYLTQPRYKPTAGSYEEQVRVENKIFRGLDTKSDSGASGDEQLMDHVSERTEPIGIARKHTNEMEEKDKTWNNTEPTWPRTQRGSGPKRLYVKLWRL